MSCRPFISCSACSPVRRATLSPASCTVYGSGEPCSVTAEPTCDAKWQWNTQLPGVVGTHAMFIVSPIRSVCMFCRNCCAGGTALSPR